MNDYKCADCGCAINEGEFKTFGVCDDCYERNVSKRISDEAKDKFKREWADFTLIKENQSLRSELQKQKELERVNSNLSFQLVIQNELNGQLIKHLEIMATRLANMIDEKEGCPIEDDEVSEAFALIKKSKES